MENENKKPHWNTAQKEFYHQFKFQRKELKDNMTETELILWEHLRNKKLGVKFRRQHVIDNYIPDFVALSIKLIVEVDGKIHLKHMKEDRIRTKWLKLLGYSVIRFNNEEILNDLEVVLKLIKLKIEELESHSQIR